MTLPSLLFQSGASFTIVKTDATANPVTVAKVGSDTTINGGSVLVLTRPNQMAQLQSDGGTNYRLVSGSGVASAAANVLTPAAVVSVDPTLGENFSLTPAEAGDDKRRECGGIRPGLVSIHHDFGNQFLCADLWY